MVALKVEMMTVLWDISLVGVTVAWKVAIMVALKVQVAAKAARLGEPMAGRSDLGYVDRMGDCEDDMSVDEIISLTVAYLAVYWESTLVAKKGSMMVVKKGVEKVDQTVLMMVAKMASLTVA
jgi:hypothetical protein